MLVLFHIFINSLIFVTIVIVLLFIYMNNTDNNIFKSELQLLYHEREVYINFMKGINIKDIYSLRKKSKYRKRGYGGHPVNYIITFPLDNYIILSPTIKSYVVELLVFVHCRPEEFYERFLSRINSYKSYETQIIYITSKSKENKVNIKLKHESEINKDILQFNEIASYFNLTIQTLHMILWCSKIKFKYLLKTDIDVLINLPLILRYIKKFKKNNTYYAMGKISRAYVIRNKKYSHYIPREIISENIYPPYLQGVGYIMPFNTITLLQESIEKVKPKIWIEDVFMGYALKYNNISLIDLTKYILRDIPDNISYLWRNLDNYMLIHGLNPIEIFILNERYFYHK